MPLPARELGAAEARRGLSGIGRARGVAGALLLAATLSAASGAHAGDRRTVVAFGTPGSEKMVRLERLVDGARCRLVDRDVDVRLVDVADLEAFGADAAAVGDGSSARLARMRGPDAGPFELVLVGKDGGVKARADDPDALGAFLERIDTMPMRRAEMRRSGGADVACGDGAMSGSGPGIESAPSSGG